MTVPYKKSDIICIFTHAELGDLWEEFTVLEIMGDKTKVHNPYHGEHILANDTIMFDQNDFKKQYGKYPWE